MKCGWVREIERGQIEVVPKRAFSRQVPRRWFSERASSGVRWVKRRLFRVGRRARPRGMRRRRDRLAIALERDHERLAHRRDRDARREDERRASARHAWRRAVAFHDAELAAGERDLALRAERRRG
jgi:hypothetical protein